MNSPLRVVPNRLEVRGNDSCEHWAEKIGILNDYVRIPYANGSSFATQLLYRRLREVGHEVTIVGARDPEATVADFPQSYECLPSYPLRSHPGVNVAMPDRKVLERLEARKLDLTLGQTGTELLQVGNWLRLRQRVPFVCVNTIHLPSIYTAILPESFNPNGLLHRSFREWVVPWLMGLTVDVYNKSDGLVVLSAGLKKYWLEQGVKVPITVIPRCIEPSIFDRRPKTDPFPKHFARGHRLLCVCRHTREKEISRLIDLFARLIATADPLATLTLVGDGPEHEALKQYAEELGVASRVHFPGEQSLTQIPGWYRFSDVFVYASKSETYGQVISEALWCGLPVVAFADGMGVSHQVREGDTGFLIEPGPDAATEEFRFANATLGFLREPSMRRQFSERAAEEAHIRCRPEQTVVHYYSAFDEAKRHLAATLPATKRSTEREENAILSRWKRTHRLVVLTGLLRKPHAMHLDGRRPPGWDEGLAIRSAEAKAG